MAPRPARLLLALVLPVITAAAARGAPAATACRPAPGFGCFYAPDGLSGATTVLVYHRGWYGKYKGAVPAEKLVSSARQAFAAYGLGALADKNKLAVLVLGGSYIGVAPADLSKFASDTGMLFGRTILAAHSGGYVGLGATLTAGTKPDRILMLDDWYEDTGALASQLQTAVSAGASCAGYRTAHNKKNWETVYKPGVSCAIDDLGSDTEHDRGVRRCLGAYLTRPSCL
jgi:hypothetical protein